jgi:hypothetical protein
MCGNEPAGADPGHETVTSNFLHFRTFSWAWKLTDRNDISLAFNFSPCCVKNILVDLHRPCHIGSEARSGLKVWH